MVKRGTEKLIVNLRSALQGKNKMFTFLNVTTRCSTSQSGNSNQHVMIRFKSLSNILWS